jgi:hypothetical protein
MLSRNRRNLGLALISGVIAVVALFAGTAVAAPKATVSTTTVSQPLTLPPQTTNAGVAQSDVNCPEATTATGGGGLFAPGTPLTLGVALFESGPSGNSWHIRFDNDTNTAQTGSNNVICLKNKLPVKGGAKASAGAARAAAKKARAIAVVQQISQAVTLPPQTVNNGVAEFTQNCPTGTNLVGGGATFAAGLPLATNIELFESGPVGNGWHARWNNNTATNQGAVLTALCMNSKLKVKGAVTGNKPKARGKIEQVSQTVEMPPQATNNGVIEANLGCPAGTTVVGGGTRVDPNISLTASVELFESGPAGNGWHARFNNDTTTTQSAQIIANCIRTKLGIK